MSDRGREERDAKATSDQGQAAVEFALDGLAGLVPDVLLDERRHPWVEQVFGQPIEVVVDVWAALQRYLLGLADEARSLIDTT